MTPTPILFTIPNFITAGSGGALLNIVQRLNRDRFAPSICVSKRGGRLEAKIESLGIPLLELPFTVSPRPYHTLPIRLWQAANAFRPFRFQLWHSYHYSDDYTEALIAHLSGARHWVYTKKNMGWGSRAWKLRTLFASRIAAQNTTMLTKFFSGQRTFAKVRLLPRGVDTTRFKPSGEPRLKLRERFGIPSDALLIGCVAHLVPVKGHPILIEALHQVESAHLLLAGSLLDAKYVTGLKARISELGISERVHFLGDVQDVPAFDAELDIFVLASSEKGEACPVALLEAMSSGAACVATDVPGSQELIQNGISGLLTSPSDSEQMSSTLRTLVSSPDLRRQLGAAARQRVLDHYTIEREVAAHEALYAELLNL